MPSLAVCHCNNGICAVVGADERDQFESTVWCPTAGWSHRYRRIPAASRWSCCWRGLAEAGRAAADRGEDEAVGDQRTKEVAGVPPNLTDLTAVSFVPSDRDGVPAGPGGR